ncbi:MAG: peptidoglycan D,D-transpeptidase FtsI family protein [Armatimonadota bacterium]
MTDFSTTIRKLMRLSLWGFIAIALLLTYWQIVMAPRLNADQYNQRQKLQLQRIKPGTIATADGLVILDREKEKGLWKPTYPAGGDFAHLTGYGPATGLQRGLRDALYGVGKFGDPWRDLLRGEPTGNAITLTIDSAAQKLAMEELGTRRGAVVALDPVTGAVLVLASTPSFDPAQVTSTQEEFDLFRYDPHSPELNRAVQGMYAPGSVFKIFTAAAGLDLALVTPETDFSCAGTERIANGKIVCRISGGHGRVDLERGFYDSCNIVFAKLGEMIGIDQFIRYTKKFHLLDPADIALLSATGRMYDFRGFKGEIAMVEASFGQGATMLSPFHIARLTAAIANHGHVLQPYIVQKVETPEKRVLLQGKAKDFGQAVSRAAADQVAGMMVDVVEKGTGRIAGLSGVTVAGKTGSAQLAKGPANGWFTCYAPAGAGEKPQAVVTVIVEGGESGSGSAGPIARRVLEQLLEDREKG